MTIGNKKGRNGENVSLIIGNSKSRRGGESGKKIQCVKYIYFVYIRETQEDGKLIIIPKRKVTA